MSLMKVLITLLLSGAAAMAQTPAPKAAPKTATTAPRPNPLLNPAAFRATAPPLYRVKFTTTHGDFVVEVHREWAPVGADHFYNMVRSRYLNNSSFYRIAPGFIVQFGMAADPAVNAAWDKAPIKDDPVKQSNARGTVVFAATGSPNSRTTQLFINLRNNSPLDGQGFAAFGTVTEGMDVVDGLYSGYGEMKEQGGNGPSQQMVERYGKSYLDKNFPKLDSVKTAEVIFPEPPAPAAKKAAAPAATTPAKKLQ
jgi:peptidyl-prolyl cis-trans isomerase A (cyclophilin A)